MAPVDSDGPEQLPLSTELTLLQDTALRGAGEAQSQRFTAPIVVCSAAHADDIARQLRAVGVEPAALVVEPVARSTAPVAAARPVSQTFPDARMDGAVLHLQTWAFAAAPEDSIDYAVMEKTAVAAVAPIFIAWTESPT